jgi:oligopeptide/dipeptide ABC transporter ATP-binding protein
MSALDTRLARSSNSTASTVILTVEGLKKRFRVRRPLLDALAGRGPSFLTALGGVSVELIRGQTLGLVGESGCGKSTLARCLIRLYEPDEGTVRFDGTDVLTLSGEPLRRYRRRVQMVFQDPYGSLNPRLTVGSALGEVLAVHRLAPQADIANRIGQLLDLVHLPKNAAERYPHEFSGGQRQRLGLARALAVEPSVVIADEPLSALDVSVQAQMVNLFLELQSRLGLTVLFITHDLRLVRHIAHRTAVMYLGRIVENGPTADLFAAPRHPYTKALIRAVPNLVTGRKRFSEIAVIGELPSPLSPPLGCAFHPRCPLAFDRCKVERPKLSSLGSARAEGEWSVACHLADESGSVARRAECGS